LVAPLLAPKSGAFEGFLRGSFKVSGLIVSLGNPIFKDAILDNAQNLHLLTQFIKDTMMSRA
jgi:hypothetical protein